MPQPQTPLNEKIQNMLDELPPIDPNDNRRDHALTRLDARWLANLVLVVSEHQPCRMGLSEEQAQALIKLSPDSIRAVKDMVKERRRILALIGTGVVGLMAFIGQKVLNSIDPEFWNRLFHNIVGK